MPSLAGKSLMHRCHAVFAALLYAICINTAFSLDRNKLIRQFSHQSWGAVDGIDKVYGIAQTKDGYLWIGSGSGLFQFDGTRFVRWQPMPGEPGVDGAVASLLGSSDGSLWVCGQSVITQLKDGHSRRFPADKGGKSHAHHIREASDGTVWFVGANLVRFANGKLEIVSTAKDIGATGFRGPAEDRKGNLWFSMLDSNLDPRSDGRLAFLRTRESELNIGSDRFAAAFDLTSAPDGKIWTAQTRQSVRAFVPDLTNGRFVAPEVRVGSQSILFDRDGALWITTVGDGLRRITNPTKLGDEDVERHDPKAESFGQKDGLSSDFVLCSFEDREGNIWFGTSNGLDCFRENKITPLSVREGLPFDQNLVLGRGADGSIWAAATRGFMQLPKGGTSFIDREALEMRAEGELANKAISSRLHCLYQTADGRLLAGTAHGIFIVLPDGSCEALKLPDELQLASTRAMANDREGGLWLCDAVRGVQRFADGKLERFPQIEREVLSAYGDQNGRVWFGLSNEGAALYEAGEFQFFTSKDGLFRGEIRIIASDTTGNPLFVGQRGISRFSGGRFQTLSRQDGLPEDDLSAFVRDDRGDYWFGGMAAIFRITPTNLEKAFKIRSDRIEVEAFDLSDGLRGFVRQAAFGYPGVGYPLATKGPDGRLWFSNSSGLAVIDPNQIPRNTIVPPVHIKEIVANGKSHRASDSLKLPIGTRRCEINYVGLSFANPTKIRYRYRLEGHDEDWVDAGIRRQAVYTNLHPKNYSFHVTACNNDGIWNQAGAALNFAILPAYYETKWFLAACVVASLVALWVFHRIRVRRLTDRMNLEWATQQKERKRIAQELHDTLLQGFTGIGLKLDALASGLPDSLSATRKQLEHILEQSDHYLKDARRAVWELRSPTLEVSDSFGSALSNAVKRTLDGTGTAFNVSVSGSPRKLPASVEDNLLRICNETVTNAIKHSQANQLGVTLEYRPQQIKLSIRDNGCGFNPEGPDGVKAGHFGLTGMQERAKALKGTLELHSGPGMGTEVVVTVPA